jgi:osmotically inducible lipoprotein OsmB
MTFAPLLRNNFLRGAIMKPMHRLIVTSMTVGILTLLSGCAGMSNRDRNTAVGAGVGAVGGAILTGGSGIGTVGGAAVGGVIGNQIGK